MRNNSIASSMTRNNGECLGDVLGRLLNSNTQRSPYPVAQNNAPPAIKLVQGGSSQGLARTYVAPTQGAPAPIASPVPAQAPAPVAASVTAPTPAPEEAIAFLRAFDPHGSHNLVALDPHKSAALEGRTFPPGAWDAMRAWVGERDGKRNLYFSVNEPKPDAPHGKLANANIRRLRAICADLDPKGGAAEFETEHQRLMAMADRLSGEAQAPSFIIDSGGGVQCFWRLAEPLDAGAYGAQAEAQGRGIAHALGGDAVHDPARIMRLPGTMNLPDDGKRKRGRTERRARVIVATGRRYALGEIAARYAPLTAVEREDKSDEIAEAMQALANWRGASDWADLAPDLRSRFEAACAAHRPLQLLWENGEHAGSDKSASGARFMLAKMLHDCEGFEARDYADLAFVWDHAAGPNDDPDEKLTKRALARDWTRSRPQGAKDWFEPIEPSPDAPASQGASPTTPQSAKRRLPVLSLEAVITQGLDSGAEPLIEGLLDQGALSVLYGDSNVGKTFVAMSMAFAAACGAKWAGQNTARVPVVYVAAEGGRGASRRVRALVDATGRQDAAFHLVPSSVDLLRSDADLVPLIEAVKVAGGKFVIIDTLSRALAGGDENSSVDMGRLVKALDAIRAATGAHLMIIHHSGKDRAKGARGHSLLRAATDTEIEVSEGVITATKQRDMEGGFRRAFTLRKVTLGLDTKGAIVTSCVAMVSTETPPRHDANASQATPVEALVIDALRVLHTAHPEAPGFTPEALTGSPGLQDAKADNIRAHLKSLHKKGLVTRPARGKWRLPDPVAPDAGFGEVSPEEEGEES